MQHRRKRCAAWNIALYRLICWAETSPLLHNPGAELHSGGTCWHGI
jgi:hypothetical protein